MEILEEEKEVATRQSASHTAAAAAAAAAAATAVNRRQRRQRWQRRQRRQRRQRLLSSGGSGGAQRLQQQRRWIGSESQAGPPAQADNNGGIAAPVVDAIHAERTLWARTLWESGVRLVLSGCPLGPLTSQLLAQHGICAVGGVDRDDIRALCIAAGVSVLQSWPRASQLPELLAPSARFAASGCMFERCALGGKAHILVRIDGCPRLSTLMVRAPSEGLAKEYAAATARALASLRTWLEPEEEGVSQESAVAGVGGDVGGGGGGGGGSITVAEDMRPYDGGAERGAGDADLLFGLPGGGACELQMAAGDAAGARSGGGVRQASSCPSVWPCSSTCTAH